MAEGPRAAQFRQKILETLESLETPEDRQEYLVKELTSARTEKSGRDRMVTELQDRVKELEERGQTEAPADTEAVQLIADLKAQKRLQDLRAYAYDQCRDQGVPIEVGLRLAMESEEGIDQGLAAVVAFGDKVFDSVTDPDNWDRKTYRKGGFGSETHAAYTKKPEVAQLKDKEGRGVDVTRLSREEFSKIPKSVRSALLKQVEEGEE